MAETDDGGTYEVFVDENGNAWAGDQLIVIDGEKGSLTAPPAGITKGLPAPMKNGVYQFSTTDMPTIDGGFGGGTFKGSGGDIDVITQILNGIKNIDWGTLKSVGSFFKDNARTLISGAALYSSMKSDDTQENILNKQLAASEEALNAWREDRGESKAARTTLYDALDNRMKQGAPPALMPGKVAYANPYQNVVKIGRGAEGSGSPESGPGATLGDAIRSTFTDRHPNAPPQQFIQQHPDRFARPGGPSTWENQGGPSPSFDQTGRIGTESSDPYNVAGAGGSSQADRDGRGMGRDQWNTQPPAGTPRDNSERDAIEKALRHQQWSNLPEKYQGSIFGDDVTAPPLEEVVPTDFGTPGKVPVPEGNPSLYDAQAQIAEAMQTRERKPLPDPTPEQWQRLLGNPQLMEIYKTKGILI